MRNKLHAILGKGKAFTLIELLIVIAIIAILAVAFVPNALRAPAKARDAARVSKVGDIQTAVEAYISEKGTIPTSDASKCLVVAVATTLSVDLPVDPSKLNSCGGAVGTNDDKYYYRSSGTGAAGFYIIGALVEISTSANSTQALGGASPPVTTLNGATTLAEAKALKNADKPATGGTYYLAVGPI